MFSGFKYLTFDNKFRVSIPSIFRERLINEYQNKVTLTRNLTGPEIDIWPNAEYDKFINEQILKLPSTQMVDKLKRIFTAYAFHEEIDGNGRIFVPTELREKTDMSREVVIYGAGNRLLLSSRELWQKRDEDLWKNPEELRGVLTGSGIPY
jgi:MraZ protein